MNEYSYREDALGRAQSYAAVRTQFIKKTYINLALALLVFAVLECFLMTWQPAVELAAKMTEGRTWLVVLAAFMGVSWLANKWALSSVSISTQYAGLYLYVIAEAVIFLPLLIVANTIAPDAIVNAGALTVALVLGLTATVFITGQNFSFLRGILVITSFIALGLIVCSVLFGFELGLWFSGAMILFAAGVILYQTSALIHEYNDTQYVAAALGLFAAIALLFWYILRFMMQARR